MAPKMLDRIEILKGPHALRFGTGFGGTINFITTPAQFTETPSYYRRVSSAFEENGNLFRNEGKLGHSSAKHDVAFFGSWSQGDDYTSGNGQTVAANFKRGSFGTNIGLKLAHDHQLRLSAIYNIARDTDFTGLPMDLRTDDTWLFNAHHNMNFEDKSIISWNTSLFGSFVDHLMDNLLKPLTPRMMNASTTAKTYNYGGRTEGNWRFEKSTLFAGADFRREGTEGMRQRQFLMGPNAGNTLTDNAWQDGFINKGSLFAAYHINSKKTRFTISGRLELNTADINNPAVSFLQTHKDPRAAQLNPSLSLGATKNLSLTTTLGIWLGRVQRSAGLSERFINYFPVGQDPYELLGNPSLDPEVNNQLDISLQWKRQQSSLGIDLFAAYLKDFISSIINPDLSPRLPNSPGVRQFVNIDEAFKTGFEVNWNQQLLIGLHHRLGLAYTYAQDIARKDPLPEIAPMDIRYALIGDFLKEKLRLELNYRQVLRQSRVSSEFGETQTPSFALLNTQLNYQITQKAKIRVGVNNFFNNNYYEHLNRTVSRENNPIHAPGRNAYASINLVF